MLLDDKEDGRSFTTLPSLAFFHLTGGTSKQPSPKNRRVDRVLDLSPVRDTGTLDALRPGEPC